MDKPLLHAVRIGSRISKLPAATTFIFCWCISKSKPHNYLYASILLTYYSKTFSGIFLSIAVKFLLGAKKRVINSSELIEMQIVGKFLCVKLLFYSALSQNSRVDNTLIKLVFIITWEDNFKHNHFENIKQLLKKDNNLL